MARETSVPQEEDVHLQPGFDPATLRVPQLRGLLLQYTGDPHSGVKKPELVRAYKTLVQPQAAAILAARSRVTPSDRGIQRISNNSSQASSAESVDAAAAAQEVDGIEDTEMSELPVKRTRTPSGGKVKPRKSAAPVLPTSRSRRSLAVPQISVAAEEDKIDEDMQMGEPIEEEFAPVVVPVKRPRGRPPKSPKPAAPAPSSDPPAPPSTKKPAAFYEVPNQGDSPPSVVISKAKGRKSTSALPVPASTEEMAEDDIEPEGANESGFSDYNPFQGGDDSGDGPSKKKRRKSSLAPSELSGMLPTANNSPRKSGLSSSKSMSAIADRRSSVRKPRSSLAVHSITKESPADETASLFSSQAFMDAPAPEPEPDYQEPYVEPVPTPAKKRSPGRPRKSAIFAAENQPQSISKSQSVPQFTKYMDVSSVQATPEHVKAMLRQVSGEQNSPAPVPYPNSTAAKVSPQAASRSPSPKRLAAQRTESTQLAVQPEPTPKKQRKSFPAQANEKQLVVAKPGPLAPVKTFAWLPVLLIFLSYLGWYRNERIAVGYCDSGSHTNNIQENRHITAQAAAPDALATIDTPRSLDAYHLRPTCMPCPVEGICTEGQLVSCGNSHIRKTNFWKAATLGAIPAADDCVPDTEKQIRIAHLAFGLHSKLREKRGDVECYKTRHGKSEKALEDVVWFGMKVDDLRNEMSKVAGISKIPPEERLDYFEAALADLEKHREIEQGANAAGEDYVAAIQGDQPLTCRMRKTTYRYANERKTELSGTFSVIVAILYLREKRRKGKITDERVRDLVEQVYNVLKIQERSHYSDPVSVPTPYVAKIQLRDDLLAEEYSTSARKQLWNQVSKIIESNSNVRVGDQEIKGESLPTWQWTGAQLMDTPGRRGPRKSGLAQGSASRSASGLRRHVTFNEMAEDEEGNTSVYPKLE